MSLQLDSLAYTNRLRTLPPSQRTLLSELKLGVPFIYKMLFDGLSAEEEIVIKRVRQRILEQFRNVL